MRNLTLLFLACLLAGTLYGQNTIGLPEIINYDKQTFKAGTQNWDIRQDKSGILYFANNAGLLTFNGSYWKLYPLPNKTIVRSLLVDPDGRIYIGGQDEIGYFFPDANGTLQFNSLKELIPERERQFADIWDICSAAGAIFFRANNKIFELKDGAIRVYPAPAEWRYLNNVGDRVLVQDLQTGLMTLHNGRWETVSHEMAGQDMLITAIMDYGHDTLLIATLKKGLFLLEGNKLTAKPTGADAVFLKDRIYCVSAVRPDWFAVGTTSRGCYIINRQGKVIQTFSRSEGLQNNNILSLYLDHDQNLWMGLDNGIDFVAYNTPIKHIFPDKSNEVTGYAAAIFGKQLYIGTSDGLYTVPLDMSEKDLSFSKGNFSLVGNSKGQVWNLTEVNEHLLMGHHEGIYSVSGNVATPLAPGLGSWLFEPLSAFSPATDIVTGSYEGLHLLQYSNGAFHDAGQVQGLTESLRFLAIDNDNTVWTSHPYRGVYKMTLSPDKHTVASRLYTEKDGLPATLGNYVYRVKNRVVVATTRGIYEYDAPHDRFIPSALFTPIFKETSLRYLREDAAGNVWFMSEGHAGVVDFHKPSGMQTYSIVYFPELTGKVVGGFEYIYPYDPENVFIGFEKGFFHLNYARYIQSPPQLNVVLGQVKAIGKTDSVIFGGYFTDGHIVTQGQGASFTTLPNNWNSFHFEFSSTLYQQADNIEYSYQLTGFDKGWSAWTSKTEKDYTNLPYGTYTFLVKARNNLGNESKVLPYTFKVGPAWYQTYWAFLLYLGLLGTLIYLVARYQRRQFYRQQQKYKDEQDHLRYMHQLELDRSEKEIMQLKNEKLETDVEFKNKELASATMHLVQKGKLLSSIKEELIRQVRFIDSPATANEFKKVIRMLNDDEKNDQDWEQFSIHFDQVHSNFLTNLKAKYPTLSPTDLKLCAYLRMNLSSKEIAQLMNISLRGVEISRYRLRKKLQVPTEVNLYDHLLQAVVME